jgi:tetratricopeptide (TPR) repeat protein
MHQEENRRLQGLAGGRRRAPGDGCPSVTEWARLAAGLLEGPRRDELLAHASTCDGCGAALRAVVEDFADDMTEAESQTLEALPSSQPEWQRSVARKMAEASGGGARFSTRTWLARAAAVIVAVGAGWMAWVQWMAKDPARLMAEAYTQQRPFEFRIPGAVHAPVRQRRGVASRPPELLEAEAKIIRELDKDPDNVKWLELRARAEMLAWDAETAIATLLRALERKPDDPDLLADLGMAYALRAEAQNRSVDYSAAIDYLGRSLKAKPNSREALYNRAFVYERMSDYDDAQREWRRYLDLDTAGAWREEAKRHLADIEQKKRSGRQP